MSGGDESAGPPFGARPPRLGFGPTLDGGDSHPVCQGCRLRKTVSEFTRVEAARPAFERRCEACVGKSRHSLRAAAEAEYAARLGAPAPGPASDDAAFLAAMMGGPQAAAVAAAAPAPAPDADADAGASSPSSSPSSPSSPPLLVLAITEGRFGRVLDLLAPTVPEAVRRRACSLPDRATGRNPLHAALLSPSLSADVRFAVVCLLLESGADPNAGTFLGKERPLHLACRAAALSAAAHPFASARPSAGAAAAGDETRLLVALLAHGADPNAINALGRTPLFAARSAAAARLLVKEGATLSVRDRAGHTAREVLEAEAAEAAAEADEEERAAAEAAAVAEAAGVDSGARVAEKAALVAAKVKAAAEGKGGRGAAEAAAAAAASASTPTSASSVLAGGLGLRPGEGLGAKQRAEADRAQTAELEAREVAREVARREAEARKQMFLFWDKFEQRKQRGAAVKASRSLEERAAKTQELIKKREANIAAAARAKVDAQIAAASAEYAAWRGEMRLGGAAGGAGGAGSRAATAIVPLAASAGGTRAGTRASERRTPAEAALSFSRGASEGGRR
jgi:hypothetical protein